MDTKQYFAELGKVLSEMNQGSITELSKSIVEVRDKGSMIYVFGNGGSGANASHFVQDLLKCPIKDFSSTANRFKAICLNDNTPVIMAYANDMHYKEVFVQPLMNFCRPGDLVLALSGSGNSLNAVKAMQFAKSAGAAIFAIVGFDGGKLLKTVQSALHIKTNNMQIYEDACMAALHSIVSGLKDS